MCMHNIILSAELSLELTDTDTAQEINYCTTIPIVSTFQEV